MSLTTTFSGLQSGCKMPSTRDFAKPDIKILQGDFFINGHCIRLRSKPQIKKIFLAFIKNPTQVFTGHELRRAIYGVEPDNRSPQYVSSQKQRFNKLLSRARKLAKTAVNAETYPWIDWFTFDRKKKNYQFFQLTALYIADRTRGLKT